MSDTSIAVTEKKESGSMVLGTGLAFAALILVPAFAARVGLGPSLTGAVRIALMKASTRCCGGHASDSDGGSGGSYSCH